MARDKDRYTRDQRYEIMLDNGEDPTRWSDLLGNVTSIASGTEHITGAKSVSFDKAAGISKDAYIVRPLDIRNGLDLDSMSSEGQFLSSVYLPDTFGIDSFNIALLMSSGTDNGVFYSVLSDDLSSGWNHLKIDCTDYTTSSGAGVDWGKVKWLGVGISCTAASGIASNILVDAVRIQVPTSTYKFDPSIDNITVTAGTEIAIKNGDAADELSVDAASTARTSATNVIPVQPIDSQGNIISGGGGTSGGLTLYTSPIHFTASYQSSTSLDLTGLPFTLSDISQFIEIEAWDSSSSFIATYTPKTHEFSWDSGNNRVTVTGAEFVSGGIYKVSIIAEDRTIYTPTDSQQTTRLNPDYDAYAYEEVADVTNEADTTSDYYVSMDGYKVAMVQYEVTGGTDVVQLKVYGTLQDDGTAADSCAYQDITQYGMDILTHTTASGVYDSTTLLKTSQGASFKYLKLEVTKVGAADDADYSLRVKKIY